MCVSMSRLAYEAFDSTIAPGRVTLATEMTVRSALHIFGVGTVCENSTPQWVGAAL